MDNTRQFLGIVKDERLHIILPESESGEPAKLTEMSMAVGMEIKEMDIGEYEGKAIAVRGYGGSGWIYSAKVTDQAGPIVAALLAKAFGRVDLLNGA